MKTMLSLAVVVALALVPDIARAELDVVTTTTDLAAITKEVGGTLVRVEALCKGPQDPHFVQAKPSHMVKLSRADLLISVGLDLEAGWLGSLVRGARNPSINPGTAGFLDASATITAIDVPGSTDRSGGDLHPHGNPHYWLDPANAVKVADAIAVKLAALDPDNGKTYTANAGRFRAQMNEAMPRWRAAMAPFEGKPVVTYHQTFNYFLRAFGLRQAGYVEDKPGVPPSPAHLAKLIRQMRADRVSVVLHERFFDAKVSRLVASKTGATLVELPVSVGGVPTVNTYEALVDHLVSSFTKAAK